jgi:hypothetical protein
VCIKENKCKVSEKEIFGHVAAGSRKFLAMQLIVS